MTRAGSVYYVGGFFCVQIPILFDSPYYCQLASPPRASSFLTLACTLFYKNYLGITLLRLAKNKNILRIIPRLSNLCVRLRLEMLISKNHCQKNTILLLKKGYFTHSIYYSCFLCCCCCCSCFCVARFSNSSSENLQK